MEEKRRNMKCGEFYRRELSPGGIKLHPRGPVGLQLCVQVLPLCVSPHIITAVTGVSQ